MLLKDNFNFVVVGGGTAGWFAALFAKYNFPNSHVTVVASSEIGILGAGEGTVVDIVDFLEKIGIKLEEVIKHANGTIKNGFKFTNWNGDNTSYFNPFISDLFLRDISLYKNHISNHLNLDYAAPQYLISQQHKLYIDKNTHRTLDDFKFALHFDTNLLAKLLQSKAIERGITLIDDRVLNFNTDENGYINSLTLQTDRKIPIDFVFDCSGFRRLIIGNFYKSHWHSDQALLPVNKALPFFIDHNGKNIPPFTEGTAMKYGWMWKIPVQNRYGCGYVFDSSFINEDAAKKEVEDYLGHEIFVPKVFSFNAGRFKRSWIKNCVALGLSSGFTEPMEATNIFLVIQSLNNVINFISGLTHRNEKAITEYNNLIDNVGEEIALYIHYHYLSKRNDTEFWRTFSDRNKTPDMITEWLEISKERLPENFELEYLVNCAYDNNLTRTQKPWCNISLLNWIMVGAGLGHFNLPKQNEIIKYVYNTDSLITHDEYIQHLKNNYDPQHL